MSTAGADLSEARIRKVLSAYNPARLETSDLVPAAVLIPLLRAPDGLRVLFTVRTSRVEHHKGEVSFPGGARDPEDLSLQQTALRESLEEVGIHPEDVQVIGSLDDHRTRSGFAVTPFVGFLPAPYTYAPSPQEVAEVLEVPLTDLWETCCRGPRPTTIAGRQMLAYEYLHLDHRIWGATARMLTDLLGLLGAPVDRSALA